MVKNYELMVIISPKLSEEEAASLNESYLNLAKEHNGEILKTDPWGRRLLAYPINKHTEAYYFVNYLSMDASGVRSVKQQLNINEQVLRHMFIAKEQ